MKANQMIPFERNRYYYGKMLISPDFRAEQAYMNNKRMFLNQMTLGSGVLCGLNVFNLDDLSVLIESGTAIDPLGREIVVAKSVVKKLSALEGYREDMPGRKSLCLRYREEEVQPVYAVNRREEQDEYENNRIREGYELFLQDAGVLEQAFELDSEFFVETMLLENRDYRVSMRMPAKVCRGRKVRICLEAVKLSTQDEALDISCRIQLPVFLTKAGSKELDIKESESGMKKGEKRSFDYWIYTTRADVNETCILMKTGQGSEAELKVLLTDEEPERLVVQSLGKPSLEIRESLNPYDYVRLADLYLAKTKNSCVIESIEEEKVKAYIAVPADTGKRNEYLSFYDSGEWDLQSKKTERSMEVSAIVNEEKETKSRREPHIEAVKFLRMPDEETPAPQKESEPKPEQYAGREQLQITGGTLEIPLDQKMKKGNVCFSEEICHGLGPGSVYVTVGVEEPKDGAHAKKQIQSTIYGDMELFTKWGPDLTCVRTAVKVFEERGSFQAAVKLTGEQNTVLMSLKWMAVRLSGISEDVLTKQTQRRQISPETLTVNLKPKEKHFFAVQFHHMQPCRLKYEMSGSGGGKIEEDGTYTAPLKSGVYEIRISCEEFPEICTYAYAVVSGKRV